MVKESLGTFRLASKGKTGLVYIPSDIVKDSSFPFKDGEHVYIKIDDGKITIMKLRGQNE